MQPNSFETGADSLYALTPMQEQLPLRPAEFVKIRDGFIAFLKQPAGTPIEHVIPQNIIDAMTSAAKRGRNHRRMLDIASGVSILVAVAGSILSIAIEPMIVGNLLALIPFAYVIDSTRS